VPQNRFSSKDQIVLASGNQKKLAELSRILQPFKLKLTPQSAFNLEDAIEDGLTFVENAIIKARHACTKTGLPAISDDSGIEVDYLNGKPGIYSARYAGDNANDQLNLEKLIHELKNVDDQMRSARYQCIIVFMKHEADPTPIICQGSWEGVLLREPSGKGGFGYDPIFYCPKAQKTAAEMLPDEKAFISHRGKALRKLTHILSKRSAKEYQS